MIDDEREQGGQVAAPFRRIEGVRLFDTDVIGPRRFERCVFAGCVFRGLRRRARVRDVELEGCVVDRGIQVTSVWLTDVTVRDLRIGPGGPRFANGSVFERVTIAGKIAGTLVLSSFQPVADDALRDAFVAEADAAHAVIDWALDISAAEPTTELTVRDVPARLVRRDPSTQGVVRAENVPPDWEKIDFEGTWFSAVVHSVARGDRSEGFLITPTLSKKAPAFLRVLTRLRDAGIVDPD